MATGRAPLISFTLHSAVTAPGSKINEDAYGVWPSGQSPQAAWVLDGVTGINDRALLPGPTDAAWFVAQVQDLLPALLEGMPERPIADLMTRLVDALSARQGKAWLRPEGAAGFETPAASFVLCRQLGDQIEISRLGDCLVLIEGTDESIDLLDDPVLATIEESIKAQILEMRARGIIDPADVLRIVMPTLRSIRGRRNAPGGYGVLTADRSCLKFVQVNRFATHHLRNILLTSDGYYRLVDVYGAMPHADLMRRTAEAGAEALLTILRTIEALDRTGARYPRLKMADDATALLLRSTARVASRETDR